MHCMAGKDEVEGVHCVVSKGEVERECIVWRAKVRWWESALYGRQR